MYEKVAGTADVRVNDCKTVTAGGRRLALFHLADGWYATQNECLHRGGELGDGIVSGGQVVCPVHQWRFDPKTGACQLSPGYCLATFPVRVRGGDVEVDVAAGTPLKTPMPGDEELP